MQKAAQENLIWHQMNVKTAYLHAQINHKMYMEQPKGYEQKYEKYEKLVYKLESLSMVLNSQAETECCITCIFY